MRETSDPGPDERLDGLERAALAAWGAAPGASADFADRVITAAGHEPRLAHPLAPPARAHAGRRRNLIVAGAITGLLGAAAAASIAQAWRSDDGDDGDEIDEATSPDEASALERAGLATPPRAELELPAGFDSALDQEIRRYGAKYGPAFQFHGVIGVAIDGEPAFLRAYGLRHVERGDVNETETRFRIGSLTQQFTAVAIMQLAEREQLSLDDPLTKFLTPPRGVAWQRDGQPVTIRHLLSHTSGLPNFTDDPAFDAWRVEEHDTASLVAKISRGEPAFVPGTDMDPSNTNYALLGAVIERVSGRSYAEHLQASVFEPAGMRQTTVGDAGDSGKQAFGWRFAEGSETLDRADYVHLSSYGAAACIVSTAPDMLAFDAALRRGSLLREASRIEMYEPVSTHYGLGWVVDEVDGEPVVSHPGGVEGFNAYFARWLDSRLTVVVLANTEVVDTREVASTVAALLFGEKPKPRHEYDEAEVDLDRLERHVGTYRLSRSTERRYEGLIEPSMLSQLDKVRVVVRDEKLWMDVPTHGFKWMHPMGDASGSAKTDMFFFKDHTKTTAMFEGGGTGKSTTLTLKARDLSFTLLRERSVSPEL